MDFSPTIPQMTSPSMIASLSVTPSTTRVRPVSPPKEMEISPVAPNVHRTVRMILNMIFFMPLFLFSFLLYHYRVVGPYNGELKCRGEIPVDENSYDVIALGVYGLHAPSPENVTLVVGSNFASCSQCLSVR
jgi:hypothetical protein